MKEGKIFRTTEKVKQFLLLLLPVNLNRNSLVSGYQSMQRDHDCLQRKHMHGFWTLQIPLQELLVRVNKSSKMFSLSSKPFFFPPSKYFIERLICFLKKCTLLLNDDMFRFFETKFYSVCSNYDIEKYRCPNR